MSPSVLGLSLFRPGLFQLQQSTLLAHAIGARFVRAGALTWISAAVLALCRLASAALFACRTTLVQTCGTSKTSGVLSRQ
ncbi:hypothetical protein ASG35_29805 [Burkholderia sp. Leaf177]|nr:hypothetical protein ASG35_29805 [Burkholderia sp. Leaf177]